MIKYFQDTTRRAGARRQAGSLTPQNRRVEPQRSRALAALSACLLAIQPAYAAEPYHWDLPKGFPAPRVPADNPMSDAKAQLGRRLFYDKRLSANGTQSCATCHKQELAFTDGRATSIGSTGESHSRGAMSLVNVAYYAALTWSDPALRTLEQQALVPLLGEHPIELGLKGRESATLDALRADPVYAAQFPAAFPASSSPFSLANVAKALAAFERTIISARSPYDRYHSGEKDAISESAKRGEVVFFSDPPGACYRCHGGFTFSDAVESETHPLKNAPFHNTALYNPYPAPNLGIFEHTKRPHDRGKFRAPSLRNVALTGPFMHDGSVATLEDAIDHYAQGGRSPDNPDRDPRIHPLHLTAQNKADLIAFLESLTDREILTDLRFSDPWR
jgi:cytochrome c peroxidase